MFGIEQAFAATDEQVVAAGLIGASFITTMMMALAFTILLIVARWKIFTKAGEKGWKSIIPIYSDYVVWRIAWKKITLFWVMLALGVVACFLLGLSGSYVVTANGNLVATGGGNVVLAGISLLMLLAVAVLEIVSVYKLMCAFGHGGGWTVLYILFPHIMLLVLAFGSSQYYGPQD